MKYSWIISFLYLSAPFLWTVLHLSNLCSITFGLPITAGTGRTSEWKESPSPEPSTAGTAASITTSTSTAATATWPLPWEVAFYSWSTAARGRTATPPARPFGTSWQDKRWASSSSWSTWALTCRRWLSSREWSPRSYWACSITGTETLFQKSGWKLRYPPTK